MDAGLALASGAIVPAEGIARIRIPMMIQGGSLDTLNPIEEFAEHDHAALNPPRYLVVIFNMGHFGFSNECIRPFDPCDDPTTLTQDEAHRTSLRYAVLFFLHWVAGDHRLDAYLAPAPGAVFTADTVEPPND